MLWWTNEVTRDPECCGESSLQADHDFGCADALSQDIEAFLNGFETFSYHSRVGFAF